MKLNFKEKYLIVLVVLCLVAVGFYYSYAVFVIKQLQENVVSIKVDNNRVTLTVDNKDNKASIKANSQIDLKVNLNNTKSSNYYYLVLVKGLKSGVKISSSDATNGEIVGLEKKELIVHIDNATDMDINLEFMVKISNEKIIDPEMGYSYINSTPNFDHSGANTPEIGNLKLLPVSYKKVSDTEGYWYRVKEDNQEDLWYSYENGIWANAVLLSNDNYNKYKNSFNKEIELGDILGFYVWIPRFKYNVINNSGYTNYERMSNIIFEKNNNTTGTVVCNDQISNLEDKHIYSEVCSDEKYQHIYDNLSTYTHPAFKDKKGFWVAKFLMGEGEKILPNVSLLKKNIIEANTISKKYSNSHILTNMEYASIILLSNSSYGKTGNAIYSDKNSMVFTRIYANTYLHEISGCSSEYSIYSKSFITSNSDKCVEYNNLTDATHISNSVNYPIGLIGAGASSTGTVYGVYDLANISGELVEAFATDENGTITINEEYIDLYSNNEFIGKISSSNNIYNLYRYKLGDAIKEHYRTFSNNGLWHGGMLSQNKNTGVILRGGNGIVDNASVYTASIEDIEYQAPFRLVLN